MKQSRTKFIIISASLLLHGIALILLFIIYQSPSNEPLFDFLSSDGNKIPETIFYESPQEQQQIPQTQEDDTDWAELKPRASSLGASMEMPEEPIGFEMPDDSGEAENGDDEISSDEQKPFESFDELRTNGSKDQEASVTLKTDNYLAEMKPIQTDKPLQDQVQDPFVLSSSKHTDSKQNNKIKKKKAQQALAGITKGYLEQLTQEGNNLIKTIGGDPNKKPSAEQLKYERYFAKIQWCLQNAHAINQEKCRQADALDAIMKLSFKIHRDGKMTDLAIMQSSGNAFADRYITSLFTFASSSFPPLPAYIKEEPYHALFTVMLKWNASYMGFS